MLSRTALHVLRSALWPFWCAVIGLPMSASSQTLPPGGERFLNVGGPWTPPAGALVRLAAGPASICAAVNQLPLPAALSAITRSNLATASGKPSARPRAAWRHGSWLLIESEFEGLEPAVVLLEQRSARVIVRAVFAGVAEPAGGLGVLREHLHREGGGRAPRALIDCYQPVGPPFAA